jgi:hypothetical protein
MTVNFTHESFTLRKPPPQERPPRKKGRQKKGKDGGGEEGGGEGNGGVAEDLDEQCCEKVRGTYISKEDMAFVQGPDFKGLVGIDPNYRDLAYMAGVDEKRVWALLRRFDKDTCEFSNSGDGGGEDKEPEINKKGFFTHSRDTKPDLDYQRK